MNLSVQRVVRLSVNFPLNGLFVRPKFHVMFIMIARPVKGFHHISFKMCFEAPIHGYFTHKYIFYGMFHIPFKFRMILTIFSCTCKILVHNKIPVTACQNILCEIDKLFASLI